MARNKSPESADSQQKPPMTVANTRYSAEEWAVWYRDTFDRECPPKIEVSGCGLVQGLIELWARYLFETVQADGQLGFSDFHLKWKRGSISIDGDREGARRLRGWLFGPKDHTYRGYVQEADPALLGQIAHAHACLIEKRFTAKEILALAAATKDESDFVRRLGELTA